MNEFISWCRHLLVSFLFHALTSLHPPSFYRNDFSTCIIEEGESILLHYGRVTTLFQGHDLCNDIHKCVVSLLLCVE